MLTSVYRLRTIVLFLLLMCAATNLAAANYYWIGGSGNWSDISHWATTPGGTVTHAQAPTADDDVFFDDNAFTAPGQTVTLNTDVIFCRSMDWTGVTNNPAFVGPASATINLYGSLQLTPAMDYRMAGDLLFTGNGTARTIDVNGRTAGRFVSFDGLGDWTLTGAMTVDSVLFLREGTLRTNDQQVSTGYLRSVTTTPRRLELGASIIEIRNGKTALSSELDGTTLLLSLDVVTINMTVIPGTSVVRLLNDANEVNVRRGGPLELNELVFVSPGGESVINASSGLNVNRLDLPHRTILNGTYDIGTLRLYADGEYRFGANDSFILGDIIAEGTCSSSIDLASTGDRPARFSAANDINVNFVSLRNITAEGGGTFTANNAVDVGGNTGWTIIDRTTANYYWVGGSGNWNDGNHWAPVSGGVPGLCLPSLSDSVFFDVNSFTAPGQVVTLNTRNATCGNMDWTGAAFSPTFAGPRTSRLQATKSVTFISEMVHTFAGNYIFSAADAGHTITSAGQRFNQEVRFSGGGGWTLVDAFYVNDLLDFEAGSLNTAGQTIEAHRFVSQNDNVRSINLGASRVTLRGRPGLDLAQLQWFTTNLTFDAGTSIIDIRDAGNGEVLLNGQDDIAFNVIELRTFSAQILQSIDRTTDDTKAVFDSLRCFTSTDFTGFNRFNYAYLEAGFNYDLRSNDEQIVGQLEVGSNCVAGLTSIVSSSPSVPALLNIPPSSTFDRLVLRDIELTGGQPAVATNSVDGRGNSGWTIVPGPGRTLYWVGGEGEWYNTTNWSLTSGGSGGECVPTPSDNVVFDGNAGIGIPFAVRDFSARFAYCNDLTFTADQTEDLDFRVGRIRMGGSFINRGAMRYNSSLIEFIGDGQDTIVTGGVQLSDLDFAHQGNYTFTNDFQARRVRLYSGDLTFRCDRADLTRLEMLTNGGDRTLDLKDVYLSLSHSAGSRQPAFFVEDGAGLTVLPGRSVIDLTGEGAYVRIDEGIRLNNLVFSDITGRGFLFSGEQPAVSLETNLIAFNGVGSMNGFSVTDTLLFAAGKTYSLGAGERQTVRRYWRTIGNNCTPISLQSTEIGVQAEVFAPEATVVLADFIQMRNITALGGNGFRAGARSTDIANSNVGWVFETAPIFEEVGFLGVDRTICEDSDVTISAFNFSLDEEYLWSDGSMDTTLTTDVPGTYTVRVTFDDNCVIEDEIVIAIAADFSVDLADDPIICAGDSVTLDAGTGLNSVVYSWSDGSSDSTLTVAASGTVLVTADLNGCLKTDSTTVLVNDLPEVMISGPETVCAGNEVTLVGAVAGAVIVGWQDGTTANTLTVDASGIYWLEATNGNCPARDSFTVTYVTPAVVDLGVDATFCAVNEFTLNAATPGYGYTWQDGSNTETFTATTSGRYIVTIDTAGCTSTDTVELLFPELPTVAISGIPTACNDEPFILSVSVSADDFIWQDGSNADTYTNDQAGVYWVEANREGCLARDSFVVSYFTPAPVDLGSDSTLCTADRLVLDATTPGYGYSWQDGSAAQTYIATTSGRYIVTIDSAGCSSTDTVELTFPELPAADIAINYESCLGEEFLLTTALPADAIRWSNNQAGPTFSTLTGGDYSLALDFGPCTVTEAFSVDFRTPPAIDLGDDVLACEGEVVVLDAGFPGRWQDDSAGDTYRATSSGRYAVTVMDGTCTVIDSVVLDFLPAPVLSLGEDQLGCAGETLMLTVATADLESIVWNDGVVNVVTRSFNNTGNYGATVTDANGCTATESVNLNFRDLPVIDLPNDTIACDNRTLLLRPGVSSVGLLTWPDGTTGPGYRVNSPGPVVVSLTEDGCTTVDTIMVTLEECQIFQAYLPTGFSPNLDGINDDFGPAFSDRIEVLDFRMEVYDRWGALLFRSTDVNDRWDGTFVNKPAVTGVYVYAIEITFRDDLGTETSVLGGDVVLMR